MGPPPWERSASQWIVLVTGANSGLGFSICERLIDEFLSTPSRDPKSHLILIFTTRSILKKRQTLTRLRHHLRQFAEKSPYAKDLSRRANAQGTHYDWRQTAWRVHLLGVEVDLCNLQEVYDVACKLRGEGGIGSSDMLAIKGLPRDDEKGLALKDIGIPRLDAIIMNAGIGGWSGLNWPLAVWSILTDFRHALTWPAYKIARVGAKICGLDGQHMLHNDDSDKTLGEVFCANLFGHYVLGHELMSLLSKTNGRPEGSRGRIIWVSSVEAIAATFFESDFQGLESLVPYESSKRLTDILALTAELPSVQRASETYFALGDVFNSNGKDEKFKTQWDRPGMYLTHPGVCATAIVDLNFVLLWLMTAAFYVARLLGSVWHPVRSYSGACAPVWVALAEQETLDSIEQNGTAKAKWGSSTDRWGQLRVRRTEVGGWGWRGRVEAAGPDERPGRSVDAEDLTASAREDFEVLGQRCWREMERLRVEWQQAVRKVTMKIDTF